MPTLAPPFVIYLYLLLLRYGSEDLSPCFLPVSLILPIISPSLPITLSTDVTFYLPCLPFHLPPFFKAYLFFTSSLFPLFLTKILLPHFVFFIQSQRDLKLHICSDFLWSIMCNIGILDGVLFIKFLFFNNILCYSVMFPVFLYPLCSNQRVIDQEHIW